MELLDNLRGAQRRPTLREPEPLPSRALYWAFIVFAFVLAALSLVHHQYSGSMLAVEMTALEVIFGGLASVRQTKRKARGRDGNASCANEAAVPINGNKGALNVRCRMRPASPPGRSLPAALIRDRHC